MRKIFCIVLFLLFFTSCNELTNSNYTVITASKKIAERAYNFAELYKDSETEYLLGGQDPVRSAIKIDCSGLVIMCYKYAIVDTKYELLQPDMTAKYIYENAAEIINREQLQKGNLIFMGEENSTEITHIALFHKIENGNIYFIDSTQKDINNDGINDINGVTYRYYPENDKKFKSFGMMLLKANY